MPKNTRPARAQAAASSVTLQVTVSADVYTRLQFLKSDRPPVTIEQACAAMIEVCSASIITIPGCIAHLYRQPKHPAKV